MAQDVPTDIFFNQIGNTTVRAVLTGNTTLPSTISPSSFLLAITDGLDKAQALFNAENGTVPNVATVSGRELGQLSINAEGRIEVPIFYAVGGKLFIDPSNSDPIIL